MHSIRRQARQAPWTSNKNPFARSRPDLEGPTRRHQRSRIDDDDLQDDLGLRRTHSEPQLEHSATDSIQPVELKPQPSLTRPTTRVEIASDSEEPPTHASTYCSEEKGGRQKGRRFLFGQRLDVSDDEDVKPTKSSPSMGSQLRAIFTSGKLQLAADIMFPLIPAGFAVYYCRLNQITVFFVNFFAIIPSAMLQGFAAEELGTLLIIKFPGRLGDTLAGLLNQTFSNAVQLISSCLLLKARQISILRSSLLGSILTNLLLTTGLSFFIGGIGRLEQYFNPRVAQMISMLLLLAILSLIMPVAAHAFTDISSRGIQEQSRGTAIIIIVSYVLWLVFQLKTNRRLFEDPDYAPETRKAEKARMPKQVWEGATISSLAMLGAMQAAHTGGDINKANLLRRVEEEEDDEPIESVLSWTTALVLLTVSTTLIAFNTEFATSSIQGLLNNAHISATFTGLIILPLLSVDLMSVRPAILDKMDLSISMTLERCMQTALMVVPFIVLVAWWAGIDEMNMEFDTFPVLALFASIVIVTYVVQEGRSNWLTGALLIKVYLIIALAAYYIK